MAAVARASRVATSTVSKALREDPSIPATRRLEIQKLARTMGYRPNPMVAALMARLHGTRRRNDPHHIAWIDLWPDDREAARTSDFPLMLRGARNRAAALGYEIEVHHAARQGITPERLHTILVSRAQWGIIIPPVPLKMTAYTLDSEGLASVTIGTSLHAPVMHRVAADLYQGCRLACGSLRGQGFRRIGLVLSPGMLERVEGRWLGAYLEEQYHWSRRDRLEPLFINETGRKELVRWLAAGKPDVVLLADAYVEEWLAARPRPPRCAWLRLLANRKSGAMGIDTRPDQLGAAAVELVVGQIHRNERGSPEIPHTLLLEGKWRDGHTDIRTPPCPPKRS
jgi:LacI family transcriptional regulator